MKNNVEKIVGNQPKGWKTDKILKNSRKQPLTVGMHGKQENYLYLVSHFPPCADLQSAHEIQAREKHLCCDPHQLLRRYYPYQTTSRYAIAWVRSMKYHQE